MLRIWESTYCCQMTSTRYPKVVATAGAIWARKEVIHRGRERWVGRSWVRISASAKFFFTHEIIVKGYSYILDQNCLFFQPIYNYTFSFGILEFLNKIKGSQGRAIIKTRWNPDERAARENGSGIKSQSTLISSRSEKSPREKLEEEMLRNS